MIHTHNPASEKARYNMRIPTTVTGKKKKKRKVEPGEADENKAGLM
jgi:hypothetical protein